jgi:hypothetical protein
MKYIEISLEDSHSLFKNKENVSVAEYTRKNLLPLNVVSRRADTKSDTICEDVFFLVSKYVYASSQETKNIICVMNPYLLEVFMLKNKVLTSCQSENFLSSSDSYGIMRIYNNSMAWFKNGLGIYTSFDLKSYEFCFFGRDRVSQDTRPSISKYKLGLVAWASGKRQSSDLFFQSKNEENRVEDYEFVDFSKNLNCEIDFFETIKTKKASPVDSAAFDLI